MFNAEFREVLRSAIPQDVVDNGNCVPRFLRPFSYSIPRTETLLKDIGLPFVVLAQAFATNEAGDEQVPLISNTTEKPTRCRRCMSYLSPFHKIDGFQFTCPFCGVSTELTDGGHTLPNTAGIRGDISSNIEYKYCSVDYTAPKAYVQHPNSQPSFVFAIDVSAQALASGYTRSVCSALAYAIDAICSESADENAESSASPSSSSASSSSSVAADAQADNSLLKGLFSHGATEMPVVIATFGSTVHFFEIAPNGKDFTFTACLDNQFPVAPLSANSQPPMKKARSALISILTAIPSMFSMASSFSSSATPSAADELGLDDDDSSANAYASLLSELSLGDGCCVGVAIRACIDALAQSQGKLLFFTSSAPSIGPGSGSGAGQSYSSSTASPSYTQAGTSFLSSLVGRGSGQTREAGPESDITLPPVAPFFIDAAAECAKKCVSVDCFICGDRNCNAENYEWLTQTTGGHLYRYDGYIPSAMGDAKELQIDVLRVLQRLTVFDCSVRVRTSQGLYVKGVVGATHIPPKTDVLQIPAMDEDSALCFELGYEESISPKLPYSYIQIATLFTTAANQKRIRVHTLRMANAKSVVSVFEAADLDAVTGYYARKGAQLSRKMNAQAVQQKLFEEAAHMFRAYRLSTPDHQNFPTKLLLPTALMELPSYLLSLFKSPLLRGLNSGTTLDERIACASFFVAASPRLLMLNLYPRLFLLTGMCETAARTRSADFSEVLQAPEVSALSFEYFNTTDIALLDDGIRQTIVMGSNADPELVQAVKSLFPQQPALSSPTSTAPATSFLLAANAESDTPQRALLRQFFAMVQRDSQCHRYPSIVHQILSVAPTADSTQQTGEMTETERVQNNRKYQQFIAAMTDDHSFKKPTYFEFLQSIHREATSK